MKNKISVKQIVSTIFIAIALIAFLLTMFK